MEDKVNDLELEYLEREYQRLKLLQEFLTEDEKRENQDVIDLREEMHSTVSLLTHKHSLHTNDGKFGENSRVEVVLESGRTNLQPEDSPTVSKVYVEAEVSVAHACPHCKQEMDWNHLTGEKEGENLDKEKILKAVIQAKKRMEEIRDALQKRIQEIN